MTAERHARGLLDTNIMILRKWIDPAELPDEMAISTVTLAELSAGPHGVRPNSEQGAYDEHAERARRLDVPQRAEHEFDPIPFGVEAARAFGRVSAGVVAAGRKPRRRLAGLMIASVAIAEGLPLFTANPDDFRGLEELITVVPVTRPTVRRAVTGFPSARDARWPPASERCHRRTGSRPGVRPCPHRWAADRESDHRNAWTPGSPAMW
jgi:predicted nucleic acid-binding protein